MTDTKRHEKIIERAKVRWNYAKSYYSIAYRRSLDDTKFANGDFYNRYQWPNDMLASRDLDERPTLTINKVQQHNFKIINDAKQNKPGITIKATGGGATYDSAQVYMGVVRNIEYRSNARDAYDTATEHQVNGGFGFWRVVADYVDDDSFDQEILIRAVMEPRGVYVDPDTKEIDKSDMRWAFVFTDVPNELFKAEYPEVHAELTRTSNFDQEGWWTEETTRICEYYEIEEEKDTLFRLPDGQLVKASEMPGELVKAVRADPQIRSREMLVRKVMWYKICGGKIVDERPWLGQYIPIVPLVGNETLIEGEYDVKSHTRAMLDPQRMYNYWSSSATEQVALQDKTPWVASVEAIEGFQQFWNTANRRNYSVLPYRSFAPERPDVKLDQPQRPQPPVMAQAYIQGMQIALGELMAASGQYEGNMGEQGNERTGVALRNRQKVGDLATYHFHNNLARAITLTGKIILDLLPKVYDTPRVLNIMAADGTTLEVKMDPQAEQANSTKLQEMIMGAQQIFNPNVGKYWVEADAGPGYATKREQAFDALVLLLTQSKELTPIIGDLMMQMADFPMADEAAQRLKRMVPPQALGLGPSPEVQKLVEENGQLKALLTDALDQIATSKLQLKSKDSKRDIDAYDAQTRRLAVIFKDRMEDKNFRLLFTQTIFDALMQNLPEAGEDTGAATVDRAEAS